METINECFEVLNSETGGAAQLGMQALWLTGRVTPSGARLVVVHTFRSAEKKPIELVYAFGLPRDAAMRRFRIEGDGFQVHSELKPTDEARKQYERGIDQGSLSALARTYRDGRVNLSVGNIRPGETVRVFLELLAGVDLRDGGLRFRFPFTLAPCYHSQAKAIESAPGVGEMELPADQFGDLLLPPFMRDPSSLHAVSFDLSVAMGSAIRSVASPSHAVKVSGGGTKEARVSLGVSRDVPDRDLVLDVEAEASSPSVCGGCTDGEARFNITIPSTLFDKEQNGPRSVVFILDRSGSMEGTPLDQARQAAAACLGTLSDKDRFGLLAFDDSVVQFKGNLVPATAENRRAGTKFLESIQAQGGTELGQALEAGVRLARGNSGDNPPQQSDLFVLTDGQVSATEAIIGRVRGAAARIHCLGIGAASQDRFLTLLARETGGVCRFLTPRERVDLGALDLFASVGCPLAADVQVTFSGLQGASTVVSPPTAVFEGHPMVIMAKAAASGVGAVHLAWADGKKTLRVDVCLEKSPEAEAIRLLQGARLITDVDAALDAELSEGREVRGREQSRWRQKLANLSQEYGLASRGMSLVAVVERAGDDASTVPTTRVVPVGLAQDVLFESYFPGGVAVREFATLCDVECHDTAVFLHRQIDDKLLSPRLRMRKHDMATPPTASAKPPLVDRLFSMFRAQEDAPATPPQEDIEGVLLRKFGASQDGGLNGPTEELRLLRSLAALLILGLLGQSAQAGPFRVNLRRLAAYARKNLTLIPDPDAFRFMTKLVDQVEQGTIPQQPDGRESAENLLPWLEANDVNWTDIGQRWKPFLA